jgi:glycosyltransferase involved in cell wall biosynthesis
VERLVLFGSTRTLRTFQLPPAASLRDVEASIADRGPLGRMWWHTTGLQRALRAHDAGALLALSGGGWGPVGCRSTLLIQQSLPFSSEAIARHGLGSRVRIAAIRRMMAASARRCDRIVVQTPTMGRWVGATFGIAAERIVVVEPDVDIASRQPPAPELEEMRSAARDQLLVLYVGNSSPYKNLDMLAPAMRELTRAVPGAMLFGTFPTGHPLLRSPQVRSLPPLSRIALREAYELAAALVMPSLVETVGLPMLEASAVGTPVAAADRPYAHDVCGDSAVFFDPLSASDLAAKLATLLTDKALRKRLAASGIQNAQRRAAGRPYDRLIEIAIEGTAGESS